MVWLLALECTENGKEDGVFTDDKRRSGGFPAWHSQEQIQPPVRARRHPPCSTGALVKDEGVRVSSADTRGTRVAPVH